MGDMGDGDWLPAYPWPSGEVPAEPPGTFVPTMHTHLAPMSGELWWSTWVGEVRMSWPDRIKHYHHTTGNPQSLFMGGDGRVAGIFIMGNDYRVKSTYYGGYPATYLKRIKALFPDKRRVLHLFSGKVDIDTFPGDTVDIKILIQS
jgi:hypothetical protein